MHPFNNTAGASLEWKQPSARAKRYVLLAEGEAEVATLDFRSVWGSLATATTADACWTFKRTGFFRRAATIRCCDEQEDRGIFRDNTWSNGGTLALGEQRYKITTNTWMNRFEILDEAERSLVRFDLGGVVRYHAQVKIAASDDHLPLLILFGWYIIVNLIEETTAATTAAIL